MGALAKMEFETEWLTCYKCGITFGLTGSWVVRLRRSHDNFYCPSGHSQAFSGKNTEEELRQQLEAEKLRREQAERDAEWAKHQAKNDQTQRVKAQNKLARLTKRVEAGVCPHCNRTFKQLAAHMRCKHGDHLKEQAA